MRRASCRVWLLAVVGSLWFGLQAEAAVAPPARKAGPRNPVDRLRRLPSDERKKLLDSLPPDRKKQLEQLLDRYESLAPRERQRLREQYLLFRQLPPERQDAMRRLYNRFSNLPEDRKRLLRSEIQALGPLPEADRRARLNSDESRNKLSLAEQQLLADMARILPRR